MTDKELLEYAAKAAGIDVIDACWDETLKGFWLHEGYSFWSPLKYDGDAFRLAVKLTVVDDYVIKIAPVNVSEGEDPYAATRRAITQAAAEIGRTM